MRNKSGGVDNIGTIILRNIITYIAEPLAYLFDTCTEQDICPEILKKGEIVPIYKSEEKSKVQKYRSTLLIYNTEKFFEKLTYNRIYKSKTNS